MILIQESPLSGQILTLVKPVGKEIPFRMGEIIEGQVVDIFPSGGLTIKVKGGYLPVRSDLNFERNETLSLKVLGSERRNGEVVLQLIDKKVRSEEEDLRTGTGAERKDDPTWKAVDLISNLISTGVGGKKEPTGQNREVDKLRMVLGELLKSLPSNLSSIPKGIRIQLQQALQTSLQGFVSDVQERILKIIGQLTGEIQYSLLVENLKDILIPMEGLDSQNLKNALDNSGVYLEAKLRALVKNELAGESNQASENSKLHNDLKAIILQLKENIKNKKEPDSPSVFFQRIMERAAKIGKTEPPLSPKFLGTLDSLVKEVETFQLISRLTDSFHTFLPILWDELKGGELIFKRRQQSKGMSFSCSIHLELEKLGPLSAFLFLQSGNFFVNFKTDHPGLKAAIRSHLEELQESFTREGLNLKEVSIREQGDTPLEPWEPTDCAETIVSIRI
jgi:hypothetical protein